MADPDRDDQAWLLLIGARIGGFSRLQSARGSLLVVAELKRGEPLKKQRERHDPCITIFAAQ
jgi:hypothetical protein